MAFVSGDHSAMIHISCYAVSVLLYVLVLEQLSAVVKKLKLPVVICLCLGGGFLLYVALLIPGILAVLDPFAASFTLSITSILTVWVLKTTVHTQKTELLCKGGFHLFQGPWNALNILLLMIGAYWLLGLVEYIIAFPTLLLNPATPLSWDTTSYHLPGLIEYFQHQSLWSFEGPYQSYSFGYEMIGGYPALFFHSHWGLLLSHIYSIVFLIASIVFVTQELLLAVHAAAISLNPLAAHAAGVGLWSLQFSGAYTLGEHWQQRHFHGGLCSCSLRTDA